LISSLRGKKVRHHYERIGGKSPIRELTARQAEALEAVLRRDLDARVFVAMRYWHPFTAEAIDALNAFSPDHVVLLPLYPQFSTTTTGSSLNEWKRRCQQRRHTPQHIVESYPEHPLYIEALVAHINAGLARFASADQPALLFSAHGIPESVDRNGDPYREQVELSTQCVLKAGGWPNRSLLCYQSKVGGSGRWLRPSLHEALGQIRAEGLREVLVVPISFVTDHVETLMEIDIEAREAAEAIGIESFELMPALNDDPTFISALADLVRSAAGIERSAVVAAAR
jgi:ferrochelatase